MVTFSGGHEWALPLTTCTYKDDIRNQLRRIGAGGGTNMYPALATAAAALRAENTNLRHLVLLTDGQSTGGDFEGAGFANGT